MSRIKEKGRNIASDSWFLFQSVSAWRRNVTLHVGTAERQQRVCVCVSVGLGFVKGHDEAVTQSGGRDAAAAD